MFPEMRGEVDDDLDQDKDHHQEEGKAKRSHYNPAQHEDDQQGKNPPQRPDDLLLRRTSPVLALPQKIPDEREEMSGQKSTDRNPKLPDESRFVKSGHRADPRLLPCQSAKQGRGANEHVSVNEKKDRGQENFCDGPQNKRDNRMFIRLRPEPDGDEEKFQSSEEPDQDAIAPVKKK